jgi:signal peptidase
MKKENITIAVDIAIFSFIIVFMLLNISGITLLAVVEGRSMEPLLQTGDLVLVIRSGADGITVGDVIVYRKSDGSFIIHRVVQIKKNGNMVYFVTKGDNNRFEDPPIPEESVIGKVAGVNHMVFKIPLLGYISLAFKGRS